MSDDKNRSTGTYRPEIEGLRAVAAVLVAVFHIWLGRVSGGVDVFFVVSGFLITTGLIGQIQRTGSVQFARFWARLVKRLVPAAFLVLCVVAVVSIFAMPRTRWRDSIEEIVAAAAYVENWMLAYKAIDYLEMRSAASPVQHYWALSVQGQFYLMWPLLLACVAFVARRFAKALPTVLCGALLSIFVASLAYSIYLTAVDQPFAYFNTFARMWEFSLGALLAVLLPRLSMPRIARVAASWIGLLAILSCGLVLQVSQVFPGYAALWPTMGAALVMAAGTTGSRFGADRLLGSRPMVFVGRISYSIYLWHFPLLVYFRSRAEPEPLSFATGIGILAASFLLAALTHRVIEAPARESKIGAQSPLRAFGFGIACAIPVVVVLAAWTQLYRIESKRNSQSVAMDDPQHPGARWTDISVMGTWQEPVFPGPFRVEADRDRMQGICWRRHGGQYPVRCAFGETTNPTLTVAVVGGSHSAQWTPALEQIAVRDRWQILSYTRSNCPFFVDTPVPPGDTEECRQWNENVLNELLRLKPDVVFTISTRGAGGREIVPQGYVRSWEALVAAGIRVVALRDNPNYLFDVATCIEIHGPGAPHCTQRRAQLEVAERDPTSFLAEPPPGVGFIDLTDAFCDAHNCYPIIGNVLVYRQHNHLTATYVRSLVDRLRQEMHAVLKLMPSDPSPAVAESGS
jgi:peptidoglycan/LPS O-acetylase OafA/YrhL